MIFSLGADITDYFNYGFTEDTWKQYCEKQRRLRMDLNMPKKTFVVRAREDIFLSINLTYTRDAFSIINSNLQPCLISNNIFVPIMYIAH